MSRTTYTATAVREGRWWVITVPSIGVTQSRSLREAPRSACGLVAAMLDIAADDVDVVVTPELGEDVAEQVRVARRMVAELEQQQADVARASRRAARALRAAGLTGADAATVLGVSQQRVSQLLAG